MKREAIIRKLRREPILIDAQSHAGIDSVGYIRSDSPYAMTGEDMTFRLDAQGLGAAVCFPLMYTTYFRFNAFRKGRFVATRTARRPVRMKPRISPCVVKSSARSLFSLADCRPLPSSNRTIVLALRPRPYGNWRPAIRFSVSRPRRVIKRLIIEATKTRLFFKESNVFSLKAIMRRLVHPEPHHEPAWEGIASA
jgi:hypothetical protein